MRVNLTTMATFLDLARAAAARVRRQTLAHMFDEE